MTRQTPRLAGMDGRKFAESIPTTPLELIRRWPWDELPLTKEMWQQGATELHEMYPENDIVVNGIVNYRRGDPGIVTFRREGQANGHNAIVNGVAGFRWLHGAKMQVGLIRRHPDMPGPLWQLRQVYGIRRPMQSGEPEGFARGIIEGFVDFPASDGGTTTLMCLRTGEDQPPLLIHRGDKRVHPSHLYAAVAMWVEHIDGTEAPAIYREYIGEPGDEASRRYMYVPSQEVYPNGVPAPGLNAFGQNIVRAAPVIPPFSGNPYERF